MRDMQIKTTMNHHFHPSVEHNLKSKQYQVMARMCGGVETFSTSDGKVKQ